MKENEECEGCDGDREREVIKAKIEG